MPTRGYIEAVKARARDYYGRGDYRSAVAVMVIDLNRIGIRLPPEQNCAAMAAALRRDQAEVIWFIEGFAAD
jgi:hypothetical protein